MQPVAFCLHLSIGTSNQSCFICVAVQGVQVPSLSLRNVVVLTPGGVLTSKPHKLFTYICVKTLSPWTLDFTLLSALSSYQELKMVSKRHFFVSLVFVFIHTHSSCLLCALNRIVYNYMIILYNNSDSDSADLFYHGIFLDDKSPNRTVTHWFVTFPLVCSSADGALLAF